MSRHVHKVTESSKQPIRTRYLGHVTGYQPIRDQYFQYRSVPATDLKTGYHSHVVLHVGPVRGVDGEIFEGFQ